MNNCLWIFDLTVIFRAQSMRVIVCKLHISAYIRSIMVIDVIYNESVSIE